MNKNLRQNVLQRLILGAASTLFAAGSMSLNATEETPSYLLDYDDIFALEYVANPTMLSDDTVVYERVSMDIMTDSKRSNLWTVKLDGSAHLPLLSAKANFSRPVLSPDAKKLAYLSSKEGKTQIYLRDIVTGSTARVSDVQMTPSGLSFSPDGKYIAFSMFTPKSAKPLFTLPNKPKGAEWAEPAKYIDSTLFQRDGRGMNKPGNVHVYVVPSIGGTPRQITSGDYDHGGKLSWSKDAKHIYVSANIREDNEFDVFNSDIIKINVLDGEWQRLTDMTGPESSPTINAKGDQIAFVGFEDNGKSNQISQLYVMNIDGSNIRSLTDDLDRSVSDIHWAPNGKGLYFSYDDDGQKHVALVSLSGKRKVLTDSLGGQSIGRPYTSGDFTVSNKGKVVFSYSSTVKPADLAVLDKKGEPFLLTDLNSDVFDHKLVNPPEAIKVSSSVDERAISAWVVKPPKFDPTKKYPLILEIHGGPHTAYGPEFSMEVQMFAAAGYVVVYGNPRGSTSQGAEFANLIDKNYPSQDYDDLIDIVDGVIAKGYVDEDNLFVTGGSGGGVLTAWIIGKTDKFKAAVVAKPVINWVSMIGTSDIYTFMARYWFTDLPWNDIDQYWRRSPLSLVGNVNTPTMVLTGELDVRTPMAESEQYYGALRLEGVESSLVRIQGAYHGIAAKPSNLGRKIGFILAWFDKYKTEPDVQQDE